MRPNGTIEMRVSADFFSSSRTFSLPVGPRISVEKPNGYYIDLRVKAIRPEWPRPGLRSREEEVYVETAQWGLGAYERYLAGEGESWLAAAVACGRHLLDAQEDGGPLAGAWIYRHRCPHTYRLDPPWISSMAQGEGASLLTRLGLQTRDERFLLAAKRAVEAMKIPTERGGSEGQLGGRAFPQEYPTTPSANVLNGGIFAIWGFWDVGIGCEDQDAKRRFDASVDCLAANVHRWDTGYWSRYDLYPHPFANVASSFYHSLHIAQLEAMVRLAPRAELEDAKARFERYRRSRACRWRAFLAKAAFRIAVPRNKLLARRLPWT